MSYSTLKETWIREDYNAIFRHVEKTGGASIRMSIGCKCPGGVDEEHGETKSGTHRCDLTSEKNGVLCLGHFETIDDSENDGKTPYYIVLRNPYTRHTSFNNYHKMTEFQSNKSTLDRMFTKQGKPIKNIKYLCYEDIENEYKKFKEDTPGSDEWSDELETIHTNNTYTDKYIKLREELKKDKNIFKDEYELWKKHCGHLE
jgi:hypothetical protein